MTGWDYSLREYGVRIWRVNGYAIFFQKGEWPSDF